jgi:hypothetical protein
MIENETFNSHTNGLNCNKCKVKHADFICETCGPLKYFCSNCDGYVHSLPSKRDHNRALIDNSITFRNTDYTTNHSRLNTSSFEQRHNYSSTSPKRYRSPPREGIEDINLSHIRDIKRTHEREKQDLLSEIDDIRSSLGGRIELLVNQLEESNKRNCNNIRNMEEDFAFKMRNILAEKDGEINILKRELIDLEAINKDLSKRVNEYSYIIDSQKDDFNNRLSILDDDLKNCESETSTLKTHYEHRIAFLLDQFSEEKAKMKNDYEKQIEKYNLISNH